MEAQYIWKNGKFIQWDKALTHVLTHGLHYGSGAFEGIRCYPTDNGPAIFKLKEHLSRFIYSMQKLSMPTNYTLEQLCEATVATVKKNNLSHGYIRPIAYYGYGSMRVVPIPELPVDIVIACWPWSDYMQVKMIDVSVNRYIRLHKKSTNVKAKLCGHYINSILAGLELRNTHYHETILLDADGYVAEGTAENIFIVRNGTLITPPEGTILVGITRNTLIEIANELAIPVEEKLFMPIDVINADEAFLCGTAVELCPIRTLDDEVIGSGKIGPITNKLIERITNIAHGRCPEHHDYLTFV